MYIITQAQLAAWLEDIAQDQTLVAPRIVDGLLLYRPVEHSAEIEWEFTRPVLSVKESFFPPTERLMTIEVKGQEVQLNETLPDQKQTLFGVRPCDARGVRLLDALFLDQEPADPYYARRRANTIVIGQACNEQGPNCFCTSVGGAPDEAGDMDIMLYIDKDGYLLEAVTEKGRTLLPSTGWEETQKTYSRQDATAQFPLPDKDSWPGRFTDTYWEMISERCISCRACAYVCPTCRCFIVRDEVLTSNQYERIRCWDSCTGENYRRTGGGHRPRAEKHERLRNRFFCKFLYYPEQYNLSDTAACTGCGRCIEVCPVGVDIVEVLTDLGRLP
ncbi:MAG: 4Fe-4S dicluster domain-containing protein [Chloroflexota bacterium]